jgi:single-strand DNA-binding protein
VSAALNRVILLGNLTRGPKTRQAGATTVCNPRLAVNDHVQDSANGEWREQANFFDISAFGSPAEHCAQYLGEGRQVAIDGHLRWRSWQSKDGSRRETVEVVADSVQFIGAREGAAASAAPAASASQTPVDPDDDIPP